MTNESNKGWNPYLAGALVGLLAVLSVLITGKFIGASTSFARTAGMVERIFAPEHVETLEYFKEVAPKVDWQWLFVLGIAIGSFISAITSKTFKIQFVPDMWAERFGNVAWKRAIVAFIGGVIAVFGARLADGCPSGHGLSGLMQMSVSGYVALIFFFVGGLITANIIYRRRAE